MKIRIKKSNKDGMVRLESENKIQEVMVNEDILEPGQESISICFRGNASSGIIDFSTEEFEDIYKSIKGRTHLVKGFKKLGD